MEDRVLDCGWIVHWSWFRSYPVPRVAAVQRPQGRWPQECISSRLLERDQEDVGPGVAYVHLLHLSDDLV